MRRVEFTVVVARSSKTTQPVCVIVITMDVEGAVAIRQEKTAIMRESKVCRHEIVAVTSRKRGLIFTFRVEVRNHWGVSLPNEFAIDRKFRNRLRLVTTDI